MTPGATTNRRAFTRIRRYLRGEGLSMALQPIADLDTGRVLGFECLARFSGDPSRSPAAWFDDAGAAGLRLPLELAAARTAVGSLQGLPPDAYLTINASPEVAMSQAFLAVIAPVAPRVVIEITEHAPIGDYDALNEALEPLRRLGARIAIDDAGAGFANVTHLLQIDADMIKLDIAITRHVDIDARRKAMVGSLVEFARSVGATLVAEGIETEAELATLRRLGVQAGQGYHLGRPEPVARAGDPEPARLVGRALRSVAERLADAASFASRPRRRRGSIGRVALVLAGSLIVGPASFAYSENAGPGSPGYWIKRRVEDVRLLLSLDREADVRLRMQFARRRLNEVDRLVSEGKAARAGELLGNYGVHIDTIGRTLPYDDDISEHVSRLVEREIADHVVTLERNASEACAPGHRGRACTPIEKAAERSKATLERVKGSPPAPAPHAGPANEPSSRRTGPSPQRPERAKH